jgi:hypothetical protein
MSTATAAGVDMIISNKRMHQSYVIGFSAERSWFKQLSLTTANMNNNHHCRIKKTCWPLLSPSLLLLLLTVLICVLDPGSAGDDDYQFTKNQSFRFF